MNHRYLSWLLPVIAVVCFANRAEALDPNRVMRQYRADQWGADQGFPGGAAYAIAQTADGYLWRTENKDASNR
jgi:ligand-binding sensor domain-containing protein